MSRAPPGRAAGGRRACADAFLDRWKVAPYLQEAKAPEEKLIRIVAAHPKLSLLCRGLFAHGPWVWMSET